MLVERSDLASKGFLSPEIETVRRQLRVDLAASLAVVEAVSDRVTVCLFSADVSHCVPHETLALAFWIRCLRACQGCLILAEYGMAPEALTLLRSGFEFLFFGAASLADSSVFENLVGNHHNERRKQARDMIREGSLGGQLTEDQIAQLRKVVEEVNNDEPKKALDAFSAARRAGLEYVYASAYRGLSMMASHATIAGTDSVFEEQPDGTAKAVFGPSMRNVEFALTLTARCLELGEERFTPLLIKAAATAVPIGGRGA